jgi:5-methylcytosine-specific restriction endonuclease McrA
MIEIQGIQDFGRVGPYERKGLYSTEEVLQHDLLGQDVYANFDGDPIRMNSPRYVLFKRSTVCAKCGVEGSFFAKERTIYLDRRSGRYWPTSFHFHFNLYGINAYGHEVMLTKDHILPRAHGGKDEQSNYQTMCAPCNSRKRDRLPHESEREYALRRKREKLEEKERNALHTRGQYIPSEAAE